MDGDWSARMVAREPSCAPDEAETFEVPPELEAELLESIAEVDRGETIPADELLQRLRRLA